MGLEVATYIHELVATNPVGATDPKSQGDDHFHLLKSTLQNTLPNIDGPVTASHTELNLLDGVTASTAELNILDGVTATAAELNLLDGVTASTAELNILDGVTASAAELNLINGATGVTGTGNTVRSTSPTLTGTTTAGVLNATNLASSGACTADNFDAAASVGGLALTLGAANVEVRVGTGSPNGVVNAPIGSLFLRTDGGVGSTLYVKEQSGSTGWSAK